jgi:hypothetical protein
LGKFHFCYRYKDLLLKQGEDIYTAGDITMLPTEEQGTFPQNKINNVMEEFQSQFAPTVSL